LATDLDEIAYAQFTAPVTAPVVAETSAPVVVASPAIVYQAVPIVIEFPSPHILSAATGITFISFWDASTNLDTFAEVASGNGVPVCAVRRLTPTAASHTYRIRAYAITAARSRPGYWRRRRLFSGVILIRRA
jgi:hypothetical protein